MDTFFFFSLFLLGTILASFMNVIVLRLHTKETGMLFGRSHCPNCHHTLSAMDLIPLFSWIFLRGKCRYCKKSISLEYPLIELIGGLFFVLLGFFASLGSITNMLSETSSLLFLIYVLFLGSLLFILTLSDIRYLEIDLFVAFLSIITAIFGFFFFNSLPYFSHSWQSAGIGILIPVLFFGTQIIISRFLITKWGQWIGSGDVFIGIFMGILLGWEKTILAILLAYFIGGIIGIVILALGKRGEIAFGPFLIIGTIISFFFGNFLLSEYKIMIGIS
jgi:prepilin signal peptidase PulO-like enzyme (type II secretory pathway)